MTGKDEPTEVNLPHVRPHLCFRVTQLATTHVFALNRRMWPPHVTEEMRAGGALLGTHLTHVRQIAYNEEQKHVWQVWISKCATYSFFAA